MTDIKAFAGELLASVGGKENVTFAAHCMTRLRLNLKDESIVDDKLVKDIGDVIDIRRSAGQYQIIMGPKVDKVYDEIMGLTGLERTAAVTSSKGERKGLVAYLMKLISGIMMPVLPALIACGMVNALLSILTNTGVVESESGLHTLLYGMGNACLNFFPILIGASAAKFFGMDLYLGAVIGAIMIYPTFVSAASANGPLGIFGMQLIMTNYTSTVFPAIVATGFASLVNRGFKRIMPDVLAFALVPALTVLICAPCALLIIGPVVNEVSRVLAGAIIAVYNFSPVLCAVILGPIFGLVLIPLGLHRALMVVSINNVVTLGQDPILGLVCGSMTVVGVVLGYALRTHDPDQRSLALSAAVTGFCGITEPAFYGVILQHREMVLASLAAIPAGVIPAIMNTRAFAMTSSGIFSFPGYMNPNGDMSSLIGAIVCNIIGFILGLAAAFLLYRDGAPERSKTEHA